MENAITLGEFARYISQLTIDKAARGNILDAIQSGQTERGLQLLRNYRGEVLNDLHSEQEKLYQIDFVLGKAKFLEVTM